ncbi:uncharacterized protein LOC131891353 [Tigriopus californicus]|uniref:uncharacterized protein LOC131891353 n=1 Tax=Tigriopus californicus TaxID=6832 RepID=UPI0027DA2181|nr:uncharacterized protein LOC131891353 [Tigriopus californicus]
MAISFFKRFEYSLVIVVKGNRNDLKSHDLKYRKSDPNPSNNLKNFNQFYPLLFRRLLSLHCDFFKAQATHFRHSNPGVMGKHTVALVVFSNLVVFCHSFVNKFQMATLPQGAFTQIMETSFISVMSCLSTCNEGNGCNALLVGPGSCQGGTVDLTYTGSASEPMENFFVERGATCRHKFRNKFASFSNQITLNDRLVFEGLPFTADKAEPFCQSYGSSLVTLKSREESLRLGILMRNNRAHTALRNLDQSGPCKNDNCDETNFRWLDGSAFDYSKKAFDLFTGITGTPYMRFHNDENGVIRMANIDRSVMAGAICQVFC